MDCTWYFWWHVADKSNQIRAFDIGTPRKYGCWVREKPSIHSSGTGAGAGTGTGTGGAIEQRDMHYHGVLLIMELLNKRQGLSPRLERLQLSSLPNPREISAPRTLIQGEDETLCPFEARVYVLLTPS